MGMTSHVVYTAWDAEHPASLSPIVIGDIIRGRIGFDGWLMSDDIGMHALSGGFRERVPGVLAAGCDAALHCSGVTSLYLPLVRTRMIAPTKIYADVPAMAPEQAARLVVRAMLRRPRGGCRGGSRRRISPRPVPAAVGGDRGARAEAEARAVSGAFPGAGYSGGSSPRAC
jgi:beta-glucosidase-like glycosyl hydrolase